MQIPYSQFNPTYSFNKYSPCDAFSFCLASRLAYERPPFIIKQAKAWRFGSVKPFEVARGNVIDTQGYVATDNRNKRMLIALRGTESFADWLTNLQVVRDPGPCRSSVHEGFQDALHAASLRVGKILGEELVDHEIWLTGHSLGGALASLLAAELLDMKLPVGGLFTFAAPRAGDSDLASCLDKKLELKAHWRIVNEDDMVPHLPPKWLGFLHAGNRVLLMNSGKVRKDPRSWQGWEKRFSTWLSTMFNPPRIANPHRLDTTVGYLRRLRAHCRQRSAGTGRSLRGKKTRV